MLNLTISHYCIVEKIGSGGMGIVYKARDTRLDRYVAIKLLPENLAKDPQALARFRREAKAASALNHPNICAIYDIGEHEGRSFIVMELLEGVLLSNCIAGHPLENATMRSLAMEISDALEAAHAAGIIHRDLKPANVFVTRNGHAKVLDFGLAKMTSSGDLTNADGMLQLSTISHSDLTVTCAIPGTIAYMSPEQVQGEELDIRTDLFSFGVLLYEMATGRAPFQRRTAGATFAAILHEQPEPASRVNYRLPQRIDKLLSKALEKDRQRRYQHASEIRKDLQSIREKSKVSMETVALPESVARKQVSRAIRTSTWTTVVPIAILLVASVTVLLSGALRRRSHPTQRLRDKDIVVLADFNNATGDPVFDNTLKQALSVSLWQSPFLNILS